MPGPRKSVETTRRWLLERHDDIGGHAAFLDCLSNRRSIRSYGDQPLERPVLERFLQLVARARSLLEAPPLGTTSFRNYPGGGGRYSLEIYPCVLAVDSLPSAIYHYDPFTHELGLVSDDENALAQILDDSRVRMERTADPSNPAVLFVVTSMFARTCWKYRGMPYQLIQQEVGALYQTMYLVATHLGLAPCAIGAFPEQLTNDSLGIDGLDEAQVGLFALGVPGEPPPPVVDALVEVDRSPFVPEGADGIAIELHYAGIKETVDRAELRIERDDDGLWCWIFAGRVRARLSDQLEGSALVDRLVP